MNSQAEITRDDGKGAQAPAQQRPDIGTHYLRYFVSNGVVMLLGFISFPILTRYLDNTQFGILRYYDTLMLLGVALLKFGTPHAIVRFYPYDGDPVRMRDFGTNMVFLPLLLSGSVWALSVIVLMLWGWLGGGNFQPLFWCAVMLVPMLAATNIVQMVVRASERSDILMATRVIARMLELVFVLGAVVLIQHSALAAYGGKLIAAALMLAWLAQWMYRNVHVARDSIDLAAFRTGMMYGFPLMANELASSVLANMDRVLLKHITGDFAVVGIYAIGYSLAMQLNVFINATLSEAFTPVVMRAYETGGSVAVRELKEQVLLPMTYAVVAIIVMLLVSGQDLLVALSGADKAASGEVFVVVGITLSTFALFNIANYGLQLKKRTMQVLTITFIAALLNIAMNFILIPRIGYIGAAWATAIAYGALTVAQFMVCPKGLARLPDARSVVVSVACGAALVAVARGTDLFGLHGAWLRLLAGGVLFVLLYALPVLALDPKLRQMMRALRSRLD
ncbi:O-antigen/teichoic acid export membrane protein [Lysobacter niabensis]|uniref:O-antigen/teichoic acid export membrane protein n=1 Tax=Agrilutibacter niabensis TaxID=380628 RepID=A0ABU1VME7_9GAMM|nr:oligosaccharide flippase family protein [Lysobacter niabensis]MDR7098654.1 O-antigen/teichoic acid export membrane protein [Lysobacter niabensis]